MALGRRSIRQDELFILTAKLATGPGHPFYTKLNEVLAGAGFDEWVEKLCAPYYKEGGRPSIAPGVYFRMLFMPLQECSGSFSLSGIKVQSTQMEEDVRLEALFVPIAKGLFDQTLDFIV